jgi:hypothetical protein
MSKKIRKMDKKFEIKIEKKMNKKYSREWLFLALQITIRNLNYDRSR